MQEQEGALGKPAQDIRSAASGSINTGRATAAAVTSQTSFANPVSSGNLSGNQTPDSKAMKAIELCMSPDWLRIVSEKIEKTIELINIKKISEAHKILQEIDSVFESSGIGSRDGVDSTKPESPQPGAKAETPIIFRNKSVLQLAIITKYNMACCLQSLGKSEECIKYLGQASKQLSYYSQNLEDKESMFKVPKSGISTGRANSNCPTNQKGTPSGLTGQAENFNEYNTMGQSVVNEVKTEEIKQTHEQLSAQLQANRYLCKFHLQLCAIQSQMGHHTHANENGVSAASIAEVILLKTHEFCEQSVQEILTKDTKQKSLLDANNPESVVDLTVREAQEDYNNLTMTSKLTQTKHKRGLTRGSSVTSLYSLEKERRSVSIRRSRSRRQSGRDSKSQVNEDQDTTHKSLERMYTFDLSKASKLSRSKGKREKKPNPDAADTPAQVKELTTKDMGTNVEILYLKNQSNNDKEQKKETKDDQNPKQSTTKRSQSNNFCPTYQVLEKTNIQEKQLLNIQPLLDEFKRIAKEFERQVGFEDLTQHENKACFSSWAEINQLKAIKRFKINVRNALGVKDHNNWIYNLNIGNVMNLTPMNSDELNSQPDVFQELSKDTMLEKIILYVVAYFCVGTEIRFQATKMEKKESPQEYFKVWSSEMWHGKSLQTACLFLPEDCPLVDHIIKSYKKHYLGEKSLLKMVVSPKPRVPPSTIIEGSASPGTKKALELALNRPQSEQAEIRSQSALKNDDQSPTDTQPVMQNQVTLRSSQVKSCQSSSQNTTPANELCPLTSTQTQSHNLLERKKSSETITINSQPLDKMAKERTSISSEVNIVTQGTLASVTQLALKDNMKSVPVQVIQSIQNQEDQTHNQKNLKRQMTLDELALKSTLKNVEQSGYTVPTQQSYTKEPSISPEPIDPLDPNGIQEQVTAKLPHTQTTRGINRKSPSGTLLSTEDDNINKNTHDKKLFTEKFHLVKRGNGSIGSGFRSSKSPKTLVKKEQREMQASRQRELKKQHQIMQESNFGTSFNTVSYKDIQRLQHNLNLHVQQTKQQSKLQSKNDLVSDDIIISERLSSALDRPASAQQSQQYKTEHPDHSSSQKTLKPLKGSNSTQLLGTPKRRSAVGRTRKNLQGSVNSNIQKLVNRPSNFTKHSRVLSTQMQAWTESHNATHVQPNSAKPSKQQKVIMLKTQKSKVSVLSPHKNSEPITYLPSGAQSTMGGTAQHSMWIQEQDKKRTKPSSEHLIVFKKQLATNTARANMQRNGPSPKGKRSDLNFHKAQKTTKNSDEFIADFKDSKDKQRRTTQMKKEDIVFEQGLGTQAKYQKKEGKTDFSMTQSLIGQLNFHHQQPVISLNTSKQHNYTGKHRLQTSKQKQNAQQVASYKQINPLAHTYDATGLQHTLKKSASTRQVYNLIDLQQQRQGIGAQANATGKIDRQNLQPVLQQQQINQLMQQLTSSNNSGSYQAMGQQKHLTKKGRNTKSTGMLNNYNN